ncbi:MAG: hypothetical protein HKN47_15935, partial [Pirellulaceae bacterium]|nr:hypothetical protein [Pirellulaceae bacterium]
MSNPSIYICDDILAVRRLHDGLLNDDRLQLPIADHLDLLSQRIVDGHASRHPATVTHISCWHPKWVGHSAEQIFSVDFTCQDARETIAREYGFADWADAHQRGKQPPSLEFENAVDALLAGDIAKLRQLIGAHPKLTQQRSDYGHRSTLLHY